MKKKLLAIMIASVMACGMLIGCGGSSTKTNSTEPAKTTDTAKPNTEKPKESAEKPKENTEKPKDAAADKAKETADAAKKDTSATDNKQQVVQVPVKIMNGTDVDFAELYTSGASVEEWGDNILGSGVTFGPGEGVQATFNVDANNLKWDFKAVDKNGDSLEFNGLDLSNCNASGVTIKLMYDRNTQTGTITAE